MTIDTIPLLRILKDSGQTEMLSRSYLNRHGIDDEVIDEADSKGEVVIACDGPLASVLLTVDGDESLSRRTCV